MKLSGALIVLCAAQVYIAEAHLNEIFKPFHYFLSWAQLKKPSDVNRFGLETIGPVHNRPKVEYFTPTAEGTLVGPKLVGTHKDAQGRPVLVFEDFGKASSTEPPSVSTESVTSIPSSLTSSSVAPASSSEHSISVTPPTNPAAATTSVSTVSVVASSEANKFHMVDLKIPQTGESPDSEVLPDVAIFKPKKPLESGDKEPVKVTTEPSTTGKVVSERSTTTSTTEKQNLPSSTAAPTPAPTVTPAAATTTTSAIAVTVASEETASSSRSTTEESARQSDRFVQTIHRPVQSQVVQDVSELFQSED